MIDITQYTNLILGEEVQSLISPFRNISILISVIFVTISLVLILNEKYFISEIKRRVFDFLSDPKTYGKPKKFNALWKKIEECYKKGNHKKMIVLIDDLIFQIFKRFSYVGNSCCSIIDDYKIKDEVFPNVENVKIDIKTKKDLIVWSISPNYQQLNYVLSLAWDNLLIQGETTFPMTIGNLVRVTSFYGNKDNGGMKWLIKDTLDNNKKNRDWININKEKIDSILSNIKDKKSKKEYKDNDEDYKKYRYSETLFGLKPIPLSSIMM